MMDAALDFLNGEFLDGPGGAGLDSAGLAGADLGSVLESLGGLSGKLIAARAAEGAGEDPAERFAATAGAYVRFAGARGAVFAAAATSCEAPTAKRPRSGKS